MARGRDPVSGKFIVRPGTEPARKRVPVQRPGSRRRQQLINMLCTEVEAVHGVCTAAQEEIVRTIAGMRVELEKADGQRDFLAPLSVGQLEQYTRLQNAIVRGLRMLKLRPSVLAPRAPPRPVPSLGTILKQQAIVR